MKYSMRKDKYCCNVLNDNFREIDSRLIDLEENGGGSGGGGADGKDGVSVLSIEQTTTSVVDGGTNLVTCTLSDGTESTFEIRNGNKGSDGKNGNDGKDGSDGKSAYQYALDGGYTGTEEEFMEKLANDSNITIVDNLTETVKGKALDATQGAILDGKIADVNDSLGEQPSFVYDENGKITGYTTKIGGADTVFPFKNSGEIVVETETFSATKRATSGTVTVSHTYSGDSTRLPVGAFLTRTQFRVSGISVSSPNIIFTTTFNEVTGTTEVKCSFAAYSTGNWTMAGTVSFVYLV